MKLRVLVPSIIFLFCGLSATAQVTEMYYQGFEADEGVNYSVTPLSSMNYSTTLYMSGQRALSLGQTATGDVILDLDTLDFTQDVLLRFISLEFDHICAVRENSSADIDIGRIFYKRPDQDENAWQQLVGSSYNCVDGCSDEFVQTGAFNRNSYNNWLSGQIDADSWRSERFDLNAAMPPSLESYKRKLQIRFVLRQKTHNGALGNWLIDNIKVSASPSQMVRPALTMFSYPDGLYYPSSRGAHVEVTPSTTVLAGIDPDSVYLIYRIGSDPTRHRLNMQPVGLTGRYATHIPFEGYDTMMYFYCVARDATTNANIVTYPRAANSWVEYKCIRGVAQSGVPTPQALNGTGNSNAYPFPLAADHRCEWVYDSALMANAGYGPGQITSLKYTFADRNSNNITRPNLKIKMRNAPTGYTVNTSDAVVGFTETYMQEVFSGSLTIPAAAANATQTIHLQDTFHYAGKDLVIQLLYDDNVDAAAGVKVKTVSTEKPTLIASALASSGWHAETDLTEATSVLQSRPAFVLNEVANLPLLYDMGVSELVGPSLTTSMTCPATITVRLKNFGALPVHAIRISYSIDDGALTGYYDWTGVLNANQTSDVNIATNINLTAGYHTLRAWVEDTLRAGTVYYRDHEPYNDTSYSHFAVCEGPLAGVRNIGGASSHFNNIEEFLYAASICGVSDSVIVNLAPGQYPPFTMPAIPGLSATNYIVFKPRSGNVTLYADETTAAASIVNLEAVSNIRFRDIDFVRNSGPLTDMVTMGLASHNCRFERCTFTDGMTDPPASMRISAMINSGFANGMTVDQCTFTGGRVGVDVKGQAADLLSSNNTVKNSLFYTQNENAISVTHQFNPVVENNEMYDVLDNSSYVLLLYETRGATRVLANKVYTSHGAGGIGISGVIGTAATHALIANNMVVCMDDGQSNMLISPLNAVQATWLDLVYNSVRMSAPNRTNIAAATFGGGVLANSRFLNNIVATFDNSNFAFSYSPGASTSNTVGHNVYYSASGSLNRMGGSAYADIYGWRDALPEDSLSISTNPYFLNGSQVDLRTYNRLIKGVGLPLATVPTDMFDSLRNTTASCAGAFEFISLPYDFEPEALISPELTTCYMPATVELVVRIRNSGIYNYTGTGLNLHYRVNNGPVQTVAVTQSIPGEDTVTIHTGGMLSLPPNGIRDSIHHICVWTTFTSAGSLDPNATNDTNNFFVTSKYHPATPTPFTVSHNYATPATITPAGAIEQWAVYNNTSAPTRQSNIYWYTDSTSAEPFFVGPTLVTDTLRTDTAFYIRQSREQAIVRITQLEFKRTNATEGLTPGMPYWMSNNRVMALQLTNVGDATAYLAGDTLMTVSATNSYHNKVYTFGDVSIAPGQSLVVQFATGASMAPNLTVHTGSPLSAININNITNTKIGFIYKRGGVIEDALAVNDIVSEADKWGVLNVPTYIWMGSGKAVAGDDATSAGLVRTAFNGMASDWRFATADNPMFLHTIANSWIRYHDNGCPGLKSKVTVSLIDAPNNDLSLASLRLPDPQCGLGNESITVTVRNYGVQSVDSLVLNYCAGGDTVSEAIPTGIPANGRITHTFAQQLNLNFGQDSTVRVRVWADALTTDADHSNDTCSASTTSLFTPVAPAAVDTQFVFYSDRDTITLPAMPGVVPIWYDFGMNVVDTGYMHVTEPLYTSGDRGVAYLGVTSNTVQVGVDANLANVATAMPSPYQPAKKYVKQQYLYSAHDLRSQGLAPGYISALAFSFKQLPAVDSVEFDEYTISMGTTPDTLFANRTSWKPANSLVYSRAPMVVRAADSNSYITHDLDSPFYWDGTSSIVVQLTHAIASPVITGAQAKYTVKTKTVLYAESANPLMPSTAEYVGNGANPVNNRPNIRFTNTIYGCEGSVTPFHVQMLNIPPVDVALYWPAGVDTLHYASCDSIPIYINVRNQGALPQSDLKVYYIVDDNPVDSTMYASTIASEAQLTDLLLKEPLAPGRHTVKAYIAIPGDFTIANDTVQRSFVVHFCGGTYTIAQAGTADYTSFSEAIDTLNVAGIDGSVVFNVAPGTYTEQVVLGNIVGSSTASTISFVGTGDDVLLTAATSAATNYVMKLENASNVTLSNFKIEARPTSGNYANSLVMSNGDNVTVDGLHVKVKGGMNNKDASCIVLYGDMTNLTLTGVTADSGFYSIKTYGTGYENMTLTGNVFKNFFSQGLNLREVNNLNITSNRITSASASAGRVLTGMKLANTTGAFKVQKNHIYLVDLQTGGKRGIDLANVSCQNGDMGYVVNNMISTSGTESRNGTANYVSSGIWVDSSSTNINVYFNSVRVYTGDPGTAAFTTKGEAFHSGATVSNINVMNNVFSNFSKGYAYYVAELNTVTTSNYNAYYSESETPFAWKLTDLSSLVALQATNGTDANSVMQEPFFAGVDDLHMQMTNFVALAQYNFDVTEDIDGRMRPQIPAPTIGAHETEIKTHDMAVVRIITPTMPVSLNFSSANLPPNIESDSVMVVAQFYNNGRSTESSVQWFAYLDGHRAATQSATKSLGVFQPGQMKRDTLMMPTELGIFDTSKVHVEVVVPADSVPENNEMAQQFYLAPAFDMAANNVQVLYPYTPNGCRMQNTPIKITLENQGFKDFKAGTSLKIGYHAEVHSPSTVSISTLPDFVEETITLSEDLFVGLTREVVFTSLANLYPTGTPTNIKVKLKGWCDYQYDVVPRNDTTGASPTQSPIIDVFYTPDPPQGFDTTISYGSWGAVRATQANTRPIRWYRDSTDVPYFSPAQYATSMLWDNTPQYFHDSTYYLNALSDKNCPSYFSSVTVHVASLIPNDIAFKEILAPLGNRVYMENDTVRIRIVNYGSSSQSNIPVAYQLRRGNEILQEVSEVCPTTLASGQTYDYTFAQLLDIPTPTSRQEYVLTVWTDLVTDAVRRNDTIRVDHRFTSLPESLYAPVGSNDPSFDVVRVSYNEIDLDLPLLGRGLSDMATYGMPDYPVLHVSRGTQDSLLVEVLPLDPSVLSLNCRIWAFIDFDRSGTFSMNEVVVNGDVFGFEDIYSALVQIPTTASYGYMRMRIVVGDNSQMYGAATPLVGDPSQNVHTLDFLLFVDADVETTDLAISQIVAPRSYLIHDNLPVEVSCRIVNKGSDPITNPTINFHFIGDTVDPTALGNVQYDGTLQPGTSGIVTLPPHVFPLGTSQLRLWHNVPGDTNNANDTLLHEYHRFAVMTLTLDDDFDSLVYWYAPTGRNEFSRNYWQHGTPAKSRIQAAYSEPYAWVTDTTSTSITTGRKGNVSYLYSPIIDISQIRPDTLSFYLRKNLLGGSSLRLEYYNFEGRWVKLAKDSMPNWYNDEDNQVFNATTGGTDYTHQWIATGTINGEFPERLQFRFVYSTPLTTSPGAAFGEGCAIDNFRIGRAPRPSDVGVVELLYPTAPQYGKTYYPKVLVKNFGTDTARTLRLGYTHFGSYLAKQSEFVCSIPPGEVDSFEFRDPMIITNEFPEESELTAFTFVEDDIYRDNDTLTTRFTLSPLENDISAKGFVYPLARVIAGDTVQVSLRVRNFGLNAIDSATAEYWINGRSQAVEGINFTKYLGRPLQSLEEFNYTFKQKMLTPVGTLRLTGIIKSDRNDYVYNDTVTKRVEAASSVTDVAAAAVIVDNRGMDNKVRIHLVIENRGGTGVNNFEVGFICDDDYSKMYKETYSRSVPLPKLTKGVHVFDTVLDRRADNYPNVLGFVHVIGDNDYANDSTKVRDTLYNELELVKLVVEENAGPDCEVRAQLRNNGTSAFVNRSLTVYAVINQGARIDGTETRTIFPGDTIYTVLGRIPKTSDRTYIGSGYFTFKDSDTSNNRTSVVEVKNYVEGVPTVEGDEMVLNQNYPNPFSNQTTIPFSLPNAAKVRFFVMDAMGHVVKSFEKNYSSGSHEIVIDMDGFASGIYFYGIEVGGKRRMRKMIMR